MEQCQVRDQDHGQIGPVQSVTCASEGGSTGGGSEIQSHGITAERRKVEATQRPSESHASPESVVPAVINKAALASALKTRRRSLRR